MQIVMFEDGKPRLTPSGYLTAITGNMTGHFVRMLERSGKELIKAGIDEDDIAAIVSNCLLQAIEHRPDIFGPMSPEIIARVTDGLEQGVRIFVETK